MGTLKFFLFGKLRLEADINAIRKIEPRKAEELLVYLLLHRDKPQSREHLSDVLWGDITQEQSKAYLRKSLWQLQSMLEPYCGQNFLLVEGEWLQVNPHFEFWLDVEVLERIFKITQGIRGKDLEEGQAGSIWEAVNIYRGDLLEGWYQNWCLYQRERLQYLYLAMLDKLMDNCESQKDYENGLLLGERILQHDRARERTHRRLMRLYYLSGDRTSALRQYQKCAAILQEELNVEPAENTHLLYEMICKDKFYDPSMLSEMGVARVDKEPLKAILHHLNEFHKELSRIQNQLAQDMRVIHKTIKGQ